MWRQENADLAKPFINQTSPPLERVGHSTLWPSTIHPPNHPSGPTFHTIFSYISVRPFALFFLLQGGGIFPALHVLLLIAFAHAHNFPATMQRPKKTQACKKWELKEKECSSSAFLRRHLGGWEGQSRMDQAPVPDPVTDRSQDPFPYSDLLHKKGNFLCAL